MSSSDLSDALGTLLQRRFRSGLYAATVADVHAAVDVASYPVISGVARFGPLSPAALATEIGVDRSLVSRRASALVSAGLLETSTDPRDRRATLLALTDEGRRVVGRLRRNLTRAVDDRLDDWSAEDRDDLARLLTRLVEDLGPRDD